jgi:hypothetical protein
LHAYGNCHMVGLGPWLPTSEIDVRPYCASAGTLGKLHD